jgi:glycine cleavage system H protein
VHVPEQYAYTAQHEWLYGEDDAAKVGITDFAQCALGDIVYVDLPPIGTHVEKGVAFGSVESVKTVSELYAPVSGTVVATNEVLKDEPQHVNTAPYTDGWMIAIALTDASQRESLWDAAQYEQAYGA